MHILVELVQIIYTAFSSLMYLRGESSFIFWSIGQSIGYQEFLEISATIDAIV